MQAHPWFFARSRSRLFSSVVLLLAVLLPAVVRVADAGESAAAEDLWSLVAVKKPEPPAVKQADWCNTPIDRFIMAGLEAEQMEPAPPLARERLIRRVYFDLWGLPPEPHEVRAFLADDSPQAYERLVDRLLASPHFGERWARYWLDVVRFAETNGYERDAEKPGAWRYRDWVVRAINDDMPYDRFVLEQLAGDELPDENENTRAATGLLRVGTFDDEPNDPLVYKFEQLDDLIGATSTSFLALTVKCARCHDHKFDPIKQTDYYSMLGFFIAGRADENKELLAYTDSGRDADAVKLLGGGDPRREGDVVPVGYLSMLPRLERPVDPPPAEAKTTHRRTQLANWMTDPANPLTPRVAVNRLWLHHFGEGLCRTPDNFGIMGTAPTHPELLDWLAADFIEHGWQAKRLHKMILMSSAYRMDSTHPQQADYATRDFANEHWYRMNRRRLEAEPMRDAMLAVSGDLNPQLGGQSFYPTANRDALEGLSKKGADWKESSPQEQNRRSIYMFTKRSLLLPLMTVFDFADTTLPCAQRNISTVAPQALALLNNDFVHAQSDALAERVVREAGPEKLAQIERAWWLALSRAPTQAEREFAVTHLAQQRERFSTGEQSSALADKPVTAAEGSANATATSKAPDKGTASTDPKSTANPEQLALSSLCHVLLNLNEFIYVD
ncbi:MAG TPA: DUF1549 and DUF1553 domain-containing protein [Pirellulales bacterium]|jgi:hypothetical protein